MVASCLLAFLVQRYVAKNLSPIPGPNASAQVLQAAKLAQCDFIGALAASEAQGQNIDMANKW